MQFRHVLVSMVMVLGVWSSQLFAEQLVLDIESSKGEAKDQVVIELMTKVAPKHIERIKRLTNEGAYDGVVFHRVIRGFMAQTGDVEFGNTTKTLSNQRVGTGGSAYKDLKAEFSTIPFTRGIVGMARSQNINSANSQFFIMTNTHPSLNGAYTVIGKVVTGMEAVDKIKSGSSSGNGKVVGPDVIKKASIVE